MHSRVRVGSALGREVASTCVSVGDTKQRSMAFPTRRVCARTCCHRRGDAVGDLALVLVNRRRVEQTHAATQRCGDCARARLAAQRVRAHAQTRRTRRCHLACHAGTERACSLYPRINSPNPSRLRLPVQPVGLPDRPAPSSATRSPWCRHAARVQMHAAAGAAVRTGARGATKDPLPPLSTPSLRPPFHCYRATPRWLSATWCAHTVVALCSIFDALRKMRGNRPHALRRQSQNCIVYTRVARVTVTARRAPRGSPPRARLPRAAAR